LLKSGNEYINYLGVIDIQLNVKKGDRISQITTGPERPGFYVLREKI